MGNTIGTEIGGPILRCGHSRSDGQKLLNTIASPLSEPLGRIGLALDPIARCLDPAKRISAIFGEI